MVERLSCLAMENEIYLAVNLARQTHHSEGKVRHFNTDLVFNRSAPGKMMMEITSRASLEEFYILGKERL